MSCIENRELHVMPESNHPLLQTWAQAVETRDPATVVALYDQEEGALWGTLALEPVFGAAGVRAYFDRFLDAVEISVKYLGVHKRDVAPGVMLLNGSYEFCIRADWESEPRTVPARFTFTVKATDDQPCGWCILDHHSSMFPEGGFVPVPAEAAQA